MHQVNNFENVGNHGERMTADNFVWSYYAHLSIYRFALPFISAKSVLDAGCGTGYGTAYLASNGATSVDGCDGSAEAVAFCNHRFADTGVNYRTVDLCGRMPYPDNSFDVVFSSNVMEHLADIDSFMAECRRVIKPDGIMIIAVPPNHSPAALAENIKNIFHVTNLSPFGWFTKIKRYFREATCHLHRASGKWANHEVNMREVHLSPEQTTIRETDFIFPEVPIESLNTEPDNITAVFVAKGIKRVVSAPSLEERIPYGWYEGTVVAEVVREVEERLTKMTATHFEYVAAKEREVDSVRNKASEEIATLRVIIEEEVRANAHLKETLKPETEHQKQEILHLKASLDAVRTSTSWRLTSPLRYMKQLIS